VLAGVLLAVSGPATAQEEPGIAMEVMVIHLSDQPGEVDARAARLLDRSVPYESLRVLRSQRLSLKLDEMWTMKLPNGKQLRVQPQHVDDRGVLTFVTVGSMKTDSRIPNGEFLVIDGGRYQGGKLMISLGPRF
jgi:hypothetical protein